MWNREMKTFNFFFCDSVLDLGVFGLFPQIALLPKYPKNKYNSIVSWFRQKSKTSFDVKCGAED